MTSATPTSSRVVGTWWSTATPMTIAIAGSSASSSAYVDRAIRAIASWSQTYGITEELMPTPIPAASATGSTNAVAACAALSGTTHTHAITMAAARPSRPLGRYRAARWASTMYKANKAASVKAKTKPEGSSARCTSVTNQTPPAAAINAATFRAPRAPSAAKATTGRNSIAATVASCSRSTAR